LAEVKEIGIVLGEVADKLSIGLKVWSHTMNGFTKTNGFVGPVVELLLEIIEERCVEFKDHLDVAKDALYLLLCERGNVWTALLKGMEEGMNETMQTRDINLLCAKHFMH